MENTGPGTLAVLSAKAGNLGENAIINFANRSVNWVMSGVVPFARIRLENSQIHHPIYIIICFYVT